MPSQQRVGLHGEDGPALPAEHRRERIDLHLSNDLSESEGKIVDEWEARELALLAESRAITDTLKAIDLGGQALALIPNFGVDLQFWGLVSWKVVSPINCG